MAINVRNPPFYDQPDLHNRFWSMSWFEWLRDLVSQVNQGITPPDLGHFLTEAQIIALIEEYIAIAIALETIRTNQTYLIDCPLPEAGTEDGAHFGSYKIGLNDDRDYAYFNEHGTLEFLGNTFLKYAIETHTTSQTLTIRDLDKIHIFNSAGNLVCQLPSVDDTDLGRWVIAAKQGTGNLAIKAADSDTILDSSPGGTIDCTNNTYEMQKMNLRLYTETEWHNGPECFGIWSTH